MIEVGFAEVALHIAVETIYDISKTKLLKAMQDPLANDISNAVNALIKEPFQSAQTELESALSASTDERRIEHIENARLNLMKASHLEQDPAMALKARFYIAACFDAMGEHPQAERAYGKIITFAVDTQQNIKNTRAYLASEIYSSEDTIGAPIKKA